MLEQDAAVARGRSPSEAPSCPSCRAPTADGRSGTCANPRASSSPSSSEVVPADRLLEAIELRLVVEVAEDDRPLERRHRLLERADDVEPVVVAAAVAVAVDGEQHSRLDLREPVDDAAARRSRASSSTRWRRCSRRRGTRRPPRGCSGGTRRPGRRARRPTRGAPPRSAVSPPRARPRSSRASGRSSEACRTATVVGLPVAIRVRRVVEPCAGEPVRARHRARVERRCS